LQAVIMAGGKGTRIAEMNAEAPKPMISIAGKPVLEHQIDCLRRQGIADITLAIGHLGHVIKEYFGDGVKYIEESAPLGTAGALYYLRNGREDFLLLNGDVIFDIDIKRFYQAHKAFGGVATLFTHPNDHPYDSSVVVTEVSDYQADSLATLYSGGKITGWLTKEDKRGWYKNRTNAGLHICSPRIFEKFPDLRPRDLDRDILKPLMGEGTLFAYDSPEYVKDMGTPERFHEVEGDLLKGKVAGKNLSKKQRALFVDRDGTINRYAGFLRDIEQFELLDDTVETIKKANKAGLLVIVVTNQPVIARGEVTWEQLREIHNKMETLLGRRGAYVDDIFICPHHPDKGFPGERTEYKILCDCRKPKPGLLLQAAAKYNIDLSASYMLGDSASDAAAGRAAGCTIVNQFAQFVPWISSD
jgi:D,D-heptose 1,7-bisphosphate phosphatase